MDDQQQIQDLQISQDGSQQIQDSQISQETPLSKFFKKYKYIIIGIGCVMVIGLVLIIYYNTKSQPQPILPYDDKNNTVPTNTTDTVPTNTTDTVPTNTTPTNTTDTTPTNTTPTNTTPTNTTDTTPTNTTVPTNTTPTDTTGTDNMITNGTGTTKPLYIHNSNSQQLCEEDTMNGFGWITSDNVCATCSSYLQIKNPSNKYDLSQVKSYGKNCSINCNLGYLPDSTTNPQKCVTCSNNLGASTWESFQPNIFNKSNQSIRKNISNISNRSNRSNQSIKNNRSVLEESFNQYNKNLKGTLLKENLEIKLKSNIKSEKKNRKTIENFNNCQIQSCVPGSKLLSNSCVECETGKTNDPDNINNCISCTSLNVKSFGKNCSISLCNPDSILQNSQCIKCPKGQYANITGSSCMSCGQGQSYDPTTEKCTNCTVIPNTYSYNTDTCTVQNCNLGYMPDLIDGKTCIQCKNSANTNSSSYIS